MQLQKRKGIIPLLLAAAAIGLGCSDQEGASGSGDTTTGSTTGSSGAASTTTGSSSGTTTGSSSGATTGSTSSASGAGGGASTGSGGASSASGSSSASSGTFMSSPCNGNLCDIQFDGFGFNQHDGQTLHAGAVVQGGMGFDWQSSDIVTAGTFSMQGAGVLQKGVAYRLNYYADVNGNGVCEINSADHIWRLDITPVQGNLIVTVPHHTNFSNIGCGGF